jgi:hypothetical protein
MAKRLHTPAERFEARFIRSTPDACWEWTGSRLPSGYCMFWPAGRAGGKQYAHRFSYEFHIGSIPAGMEIDHTCRNRACVNPAHLEAVTSETNIRRSYGWTQVDGQWFCKTGHLVDGGNFRAGTGCLRCSNAYHREYRRARPAFRQAENERRSRPTI